MIKSLNPNNGWCNPPLPEGRKKQEQTKLLKMAKKKGEGRKEKKKGRSNSDYSFERKTE